MFTKNRTLFFVILIITAIFRLWHLDSLPPSLNWDEISHGYNAYSLIQTGKDQWGSSWPKFNFRAYGDYPTVANLYLTIPFVKFMGLNAFSIRLPSAIFGLIFVIFCYFLGLLLFNSQLSALLLMFLSAISPWTLFPSRAVFQSTIAQTLFVSGVVLLLFALKSKPKLLPFGTLLYFLSMYAYHNTRIAAPLLFVVIVFIYRRSFVTIYRSHRNILLISLCLLLVLAIPSIINLIQPQSQARGLWVSVLSPAAVNEINERRRLFIGPVLLNKLINNKISYFVPKFIGNYLNLFNPIPLFFTGTTQYQFNVPGFGLMFSFWIPFFYLGLVIFVFSLRKNISYRFLAAWYLIGLLPAAMTVGDFPAIRAVSVLPVPFLIIIIGFNQFLTFLKSKQSQKILIALFLIISTIQFSFYWRKYVISYPLNYSWSWQYGYKQIVNYAKMNYPKYNHIIVTKKYGEPHEFILFYWPWNPAAYQNNTVDWNYHADWYWVDGFDKFRFVNDWEIKDLPPQKLARTLLITSPGNFPPKNVKLLQTVNFLDGKPAFDIVTYD